MHVAFATGSGSVVAHAFIFWGHPGAHQRQEPARSLNEAAIDQVFRAASRLHEDAPVIVCGDFNCDEKSSSTLAAIASSGKWTNAQAECARRKGKPVEPTCGNLLWSFLDPPLWSQLEGRTCATRLWSQPVEASCGASVSR